MITSYLIIVVSILCGGLFIYKMINSPEKINLNNYEEKLIDYFEEVALNSEFGKSPKRIIKWNSKMLLYIYKNKEYKVQVDKILEVIKDINQITDKNFKIEIVDNESKANSIIFLGSKNQMKKVYPSFFDGVENNLTGLVDIEFDLGNYEITSSKIFIDTGESIEVQLSTIIEEITQSIGLPADSETYPNSIFYENQILDGNLNEKLSLIDIDIVKLLYHPRIKSGYNTLQVKNTFKRILKSEPNYFSGNLEKIIP